jgi:hypothetical protein
MHRRLILLDLRKEATEIFGDALLVSAARCVSRRISGSSIGSPPGVVRFSFSTANASLFLINDISALSFK